MSQSLEEHRDEPSSLRHTQPMRPEERQKYHNDAMLEVANLVTKVRKCCSSGNSCCLLNALQSDMNQVIDLVRECRESLHNLDSSQKKDYLRDLFVATITGALLLHVSYNRTYQMRIRC